MNSAEILELLKYGEHINLECKKAESNLPKSMVLEYGKRILHLQIQMAA